MREFLKKKGVSLSFKVYFIDALSNMALGLFASLIVGVIIKTIGEQINAGAFSTFLIEMGVLAMGMMGPAIGGAVAYGLKAPQLVLFAATVSGLAGAELGGPAGAIIAALISTEIGKLVSKETSLDIIVTPLVVVFSGYTVAAFIGPLIDSLMKGIGQLIMWGTEQQPLLMGIIVALLMGFAISGPVSSAAIAMMLDLNGLAAGAATIGCAAQMVGFASSSYRENKFAGLVALGIGTSKLQMPNILKNPLILLPPTIAGVILGPISTVVFKMENVAAGAGMGTSGLVGQIMTFTTMGFSLTVLLKVILIHFIGPAIISLIISEYMRKKGWIKFGDMKLDMGDEK
ncbi:MULTISPECIES: PTS transporter subunit IIC [Cytobacillus]|uniref:PTS sugar transporter subunit IIC n=1 Tax=Cytobacillus stercorigallinarum TaxID=2762240 RepID=A0ABR8QJ11_9BACI|nr:PTS sugar transporter subunit IIC [Cytobacillus stercorigallinarum]MBD7935500.1 PTS sugar transporter subunit IIC [Cytobacillus stercorigallinarum]